MEFGRTWSGDGDFFDAGDQGIGEIHDLQAFRSYEKRTDGEVTSSRDEPGENLIPGNRNEKDVETQAFIFLRIFLIDPLLEGFEELVGAAVLDAVDDVVLRFGRGYEHANEAALEHGIEIACPGRGL